MHNNTDVAYMRLLHAIPGRFAFDIDIKIEGGLCDVQYVTVSYAGFFACEPLAQFPTPETVSKLLALA